MHIYIHMQSQGTPPPHVTPAFVIWRVDHESAGPSAWDPCSEMRCRESVVCPVLVCVGYYWLARIYSGLSVWQLFSGG